MKALALYMKRHGFTQRDVAEKLDIHETMLSKWMRGKQLPNGKNMRLISKRLNIPLQELL